MKKITLDEAVSYFDSQCPNQFSREDKVNWINELDEMVFENIIKSRVNPGILSFTPYDSDADGEKELLIPFMFKDIYRFYIEKSVAFSNREITAYNNASQMFRAFYDEYFSWYNRNHKSAETQRFSI